MQFPASVMCSTPAPTVGQFITPIYRTRTPTRFPLVHFSESQHLSVTSDFDTIQSVLGTTTEATVPSPLCHIPLVERAVNLWREQLRVRTDVGSEDLHDAFCAEHHNSVDLVVGPNWGIR